MKISFCVLRLSMHQHCLIVTFDVVTTKRLSARPSKLLSHTHSMQPEKNKQQHPEQNGTKLYLLIKCTNIRLFYDYCYTSDEFCSIVLFLHRPIIINHLNHIPLIHISLSLSFNNQQFSSIFSICRMY